MGPIGYDRPVIMLVEDSSDIRQLMVDLLEEYTVLSFPSGQSALEYIWRHPEQRIDLVISDYEMPGTKGVETLDQIRSIMPLVRTILMSGSIVGSLEELARCHHFDGCLAKPFAIKDLFALVKQALAESPRARPGNGSGEQPPAPGPVV